MTEQEERSYKKLYDEAFQLLKNHWNDKDFGTKDEEIKSNNPLDYYKEGSIMYDYIIQQSKRPKSGLWQALLLDVVDHLERKMRYERRKADDQ